MRLCCCYADTAAQDTRLAAQLRAGQRTAFDAGSREDINVPTGNLDLDLVVVQHHHQRVADAAETALVKRRSRVILLRDSVEVRTNTVPNGSGDRQQAQIDRCEVDLAASVNRGERRKGIVRSSHNRLRNGRTKADRLAVRVRTVHRRNQDRTIRLRKLRCVGRAADIDQRHISVFALHPCHNRLCGVCVQRDIAATVSECREHSWLLYCRSIVLNLFRESGN